MMKARAREGHLINAFGVCLDVIYTNVKPVFGQTNGDRLAAVRVNIMRRMRN